jgi:uncharacterized repeat protein (TIGR01451 family)
MVPGGRVEYRVFYENVGVVTEPVSITDTMPLWSDFSGAWWGEGNQPNAGQPLTGTVMIDDKLIWDLGQLEGGGARWFHVEMWLSSNLQVGETITNTTEVAPASFETSLADNQDTRIDVLNDFGPNLAVTKSNEWRVPEYDQLTYSVRFSNIGSQGVGGVLITDTFPLGTHWDGWWQTEFPNVSLVLTSTETAVWYVEGLNAGEVGWLHFNADLDQPGVPLQLFTNTVQIMIPQGDVNPSDNSYTDVAFSRNSITEVHLYAETGRSRVWGVAHEGGAITGTVQLDLGDQSLMTQWDLACGGCWEFPDVGPILAGDTITVTTGAGIPVVIEVPTPITATADSDTNLVWGQIDHLDREPVEVELLGGPLRLVDTNDIGHFMADFPDVPLGARGETRYRTVNDFTPTTIHRHFYTNDLVLRTDTSRDVLEGDFEAGHVIYLEVTDSGGAIKATAEVTTTFPVWWGTCSGWSTQIGEPWVPERPDIVAGDWVNASDDLGQSASLRVGQITGTVDIDADTVYGQIFAPWLANPAPATCGVLVDGGPGFDFTVDPNGGDYLCDFGSVGWDLLPGQEVEVQYQDPDGHWVINRFPDPPPILGIEMHAIGQPTTGGNFEYVVIFRNDGVQPAHDTVVTDTLPVGTSYLGNTSFFTVTINQDVAVFDVGTLDAGVEIDFSLFAQINQPVTTTITNTVEIDASNVVTPTLPAPAVWVNVIQPNDTDLQILTVPSTPEPEPDSDLVWAVEVCNLGSTSSAAVVITDTLPVSTPLTNWMTDQRGWTEVLQNPGLLVVERPTVSGSSCSTLELITHVPPDAIPGAQLCNVVEVATDNDVNIDNNVNMGCVNVGGAVPAIEIQKATNGEDADDPPGPYIPVGEPVTWTYAITNTGNITLTAVTVEDNQPGVIPDCPFDTLGPGEQRECTASGVAVEGQYTNVGTVTGVPSGGSNPVIADDASHYYGMTPGITIQKLTNGEDADDPPGPYIPVGELVTWTYAITNTGNITLTVVTVEDNQPGVIPDCPFDTLGPGEQRECTASGVAVEGQYENIGIANGIPPVGDPVGDNDPSHYFGFLDIPLFEDGFESGDTSAWSHTVP